jgi:hypothetical protein
MDRRTFISVAAAFGGTLSRPVRRALAAATDAGALPAAPRVLDPDRRRLLGILTERVLPETDTPGAIAVGVPDFIEFMLAEGFDAAARERFLGGLDEVERLARAQFGASYAALAPAEQDALLGRLEAERAGDAHPPFFQVLKELTLVGYFTSEAGAAEVLRFLPAPGRYHACVPLEAGDRAFFYSTPLDKLV